MRGWGSSTQSQIGLLFTSVRETAEPATMLILPPYKRGEISMFPLSRNYSCGPFQWIL